MNKSTDRNLQVERAGAVDWERYRALRLGALGESPDAFWTRLDDERDQPDSFWQGRMGGAVNLIATCDGVDAGLAVVARLRDCPADGGLFSVWVAPTARGLGVGERLTRAAIEVAREQGFGRLVLEVSDHNAPAIRLYARLGFAPTGVSGTMPAPRDHIPEHQRALVL